MGAIVVAIVGTGEDDDAPEPRITQVEPRAPRIEPRPEPAPPPRRRPEPERDGKGYPQGTEERFVRTCEERTPLSENVCGCVYERLHDEYDYAEFRELIEEIDPETREVPNEILEHVARCRLFG